MQEQDLIKAYNKRFEYYQEKFSRDRIFPFTEIKIKEGGEKKISVEAFFDIFVYNSILIPSKYLEISDEIIDFAALMNFLPVEFRFDYLVKLIFLLHFQNSENPKIKALWDEINKYFSDTMNKIFFTDHYIHFYLKDITLNELLFEFTTGINPIYKEEGFFAVFVNWIKIVYSKKINIGTMRDIITSISDLQTFDDFLEATDKIYEKYSISSSLLSRNYSKIGLDRFFVFMKFIKKEKSQYYLEKFFFKIPFFSHFVFINNTCLFICFIPAKFVPYVIEYMKKLQNIKIIDKFLIDFNNESNFELEFENTIARDQNLYKILPFISKKFRQNKSLAPHLKKLPEMALVKYHQTFPKSIHKIDSTFDALDFFLFFNTENNLIENETIHNLIEKNLLVSSLLYLNSKQIKKTYDLLFTDCIIQINRKIPINDFEKLLRKNYPKKKSIEKLITLFRVLRIPDTSYLTKNFFEGLFLTLGNEFNRYFINRSDHSMTEFKFRFDILFNKGYLKKYFNISVFILMNPNTINLSVLAKSNLELTRCLFYISSKACKNSIYYEILLTQDTYLLLSKFFLQDILISIGIKYLFKSSFISFDVVSFFDFNKRDWDEQKFKKYIQSLQKETSYEKNIPTLKIDLGKWQEKLPVFQYFHFFKDLRYFNKLNDISKKSTIDRKKVIGFFKSYIQNQQFNFDLITNEFDFKVTLEQYPTLKKSKRVFIIISQPGTNINPFILKKTRVFSILFSNLLQNGWYYGCSMDNILIFEYLVKKEDLKNKESDWNVSIKNLKVRYPELNLKIYELKEDLRFFNEQSLYSLDWYYDDYIYLKQSLNLELDELEIKNEISYIFDSRFQCKEYHSNFLPWEFWHIIGYPVSVSIIIEISKDELNLIKKLITRLPAGQIFTFKKVVKSNKLTLLAIVQLRNSIDRFFENIIPALNGLSCKYYVSLIIPLSSYGEQFISK